MTRRALAAVLRHLTLRGPLTRTGLPRRLGEIRNRVQRSLWRLQVAGIEPGADEIEALLVSIVEGIRRKTLTLRVMWFTIGAAVGWGVLP